MQQHTSLYRRHRPRSFADVVGQQHVVQTLTNAIELDKVHHAYLFVGSRGTGKTSLAKILAAALNCEHGPTVRPCGECEACLAIAQARSLDVVEMDAASNNSVDDIRALRDQVVYAPVSGKHKVYILDEAHMLSKQAWNAFLKTLEEPPPRTVFVLATTEADKVLATVADRCHRFDFTRPSVEQLSTVVERVAKIEQLSLEAEANRLIARQARGSFRDALGLLEQLVTYAGKTITSQDVAQLLGLADFDLLHSLFNNIVQRTPTSVFSQVEQALSLGYEPEGVLRDLEEYARILLLVAAIGQVPAEHSLSQERDQRLKEQAEQAGLGTVTFFLDVLAESLHAIRFGADARLRLELTLVKAATQQIDDRTPSALLARVERLERALMHSQPVNPVSSVSQPTDEVVLLSQNENQRSELETFDERDSVDVLSHEEPLSNQEPTAPSSQVSQQVSEKGVIPQADDLEENQAVAQENGVDLQSLQRVWPSVLAAVREKNALLAALLEKANLSDLVDHTLKLSFPAKDDFVCRKAGQDAHVQALSEAIFATVHQRLRLQYCVSDEDAKQPHSSEEISQTLTEDEVVARFAAAFNGKELLPEEKT